MLRALGRIVLAVLAAAPGLALAVAAKPFVLGEGALWLGLLLALALPLAVIGAPSRLPRGGAPA
jgi:hypothetical protein